MGSSCRATIWKPESERKRRNPSMNIGCGDRRQTFRLDFARAFAIVSKASAINLQRQGRRIDDFIPDTGWEGQGGRDEPLLRTFSNRSWEPLFQD
jgi:hypothetical protein